MFWKLDLFLSSGGVGGKTPTLFGPLERANQWLSWKSQRRRLLSNGGVNTWQKIAEPEGWPLLGNGSVNMSPWQWICTRNGRGIVRNGVFYAIYSAVWISQDSLQTRRKWVLASGGRDQELRPCEAMRQQQVRTWTRKHGVGSRYQATTNEDIDWEDLVVP
jgi:hypothetical protein